jgi:hypothetical protein
VNGGDAWRCWIDTTLGPPNEIVDWTAAPPFHGRTYYARGRLVLVLISILGLEGCRTH